MTMPDMPREVADAVLETYAQWAPYTGAASLDVPQDEPEPDPVADLLADIGRNADALLARIEYFRAHPVFPPSRIEQHARETALRMIADEPEDEQDDGPRVMHADGPLIVGGELVHRHRTEPES